MASNFSAAGPAQKLIAEAGSNGATLGIVVNTRGSSRTSVPGLGIAD